ncbi:MAG: hypothetical protein BWK75_07065 [Candidatus Altiarchaeales archaeon A3]|nr:MAG: hypothetical protein BWK75_07065 [Candidatus Altiarchaeales archaeon A3]
MIKEYIKRNPKLLRLVIEGLLAFRLIPVPPTHSFKVNTLKEFQKRFNVNCLIETGTYLGDTVDDVKNNFKKIYTIELSDSFYNGAVKRFSEFPHIKILHGNSSKILPDILNSISTPCLFWLDAHYSGGNTAKGDLETPIISELKIIKDHKVKNHLILIDDARCFTGNNDYPTLHEVFRIIKTINDTYKIEVKKDIIRAYVYPKI